MALTQIAAMPHFIGAYGTSDIDYVLLIYFNDITLKLQVYYPTYDQYLELDLDTLTPITSATGSSDEVALTFFENGSGIGGRILSESTKTEFEWFLIDGTPAFPYAQIITTPYDRFCDLSIDSLDITDTQITVNASSSYEPILYSIDGENFQDSPVFNGLDYNTSYFLNVRDAKGCTLSKNVQTRPKKYIYGVKYNFEYTDILGVPTQVQILEGDYTGAINNISNADREPLTIKMNGTGDDISKSVRTTNATFTFISELFEYQELYIPSSNKLKIRVLKNGLHFWEGFVLPEMFAEDYQKPKHFVRIEASDLGYLREIQYNGEGLQSVLNIMLDALNLMFEWTKVAIVSNKYAENMDTTKDALSQTFVRAENFKGMSYFEVLERVLFGYRGVLWNGIFWVFDPLDTSAQTAYFYELDGTELTPAAFSPILQTLQTEKRKHTWVGGASVDVLPAAQQVVFKKEIGTKKIFEGFTLRDFAFDIPLSSLPRNGLLGSPSAYDLPTDSIFIANIFADVAGVPPFEFWQIDQNVTDGVELKSGSLNSFDSEMPTAAVLNDKKLACRFYGGLVSVSASKITRFTSPIELNPASLANYSFFTTNAFPHFLEIKFSLIVNAETDGTCYLPMSIQIDDKFADFEKLNFSENNEKIQFFEAKTNVRSEVRLRVSLRGAYNVLETLDTELKILWYQITRDSRVSNNTNSPQTVSSYDISEMSISVLPNGTDYPENISEIVENPVKGDWRTKFDVPIFLSDADPEIPNSKYQYGFGLFDHNGNDFAHWNGKGTFEMHVKTALSSQYFAVRQVLNGTMRGGENFSFLAYLIDYPNPDRTFRINSAVYKDRLQDHDVEFVELADPAEISVSNWFLKILSCAENDSTWYLKILECIDLNEENGGNLDNTNTIYSYVRFILNSNFGTDIIRSGQTVFGGGGINKYKIPLKAGGGIIAFDIDATLAKMEIYHNGTQKATSGSNITNFSNVKYSTSDLQGLPYPAQYIQSTKVVADNIAAFNAAYPSQVIPLTSGYKQRIFWAYTSADYAVQNYAEFVACVPSGQSFRALRLLNEVRNRVKVSGFDANGQAVEYNLQDTQTFGATFQSGTQIIIELEGEFSQFQDIEGDSVLPKYIGLTGDVDVNINFD